MVGILGDRSAMGVDGRNCAGSWGVVGRDRSSTGDVLEAEDFLDEDDSNLVRLFFFFRGFTAAAETPVGFANGSPIPLLSVAISYWFSQGVCRWDSCQSTESCSRQPSQQRWLLLKDCSIMPDIPLRTSFADSLRSYGRSQLTRLGCR